jgi:hypothetical protein
MGRIVFVPQQNMNLNVIYNEVGIDTEYIKTGELGAVTMETVNEQVVTKSLNKINTSINSRDDISMRDID